MKYLKCIPVLLGLAAMQLGCATEDPEESDAMTAVSIAISAPEETDTKSSTLGVAPVRTFAYSDVAKILIDVHDTTTGQAWYLNLEMSVVGGDWTATIPFLPVNTDLTFSAEALDSADAVLFSGSTAKTLTQHNDSVVINLVPVTDGDTYDMPQLVKITYPSELEAGQSSNVIFTVQSNAGDRIDYTITPATGGGTFLPEAGSITLLNTAADFVSLYTAPDVTEQTSFTHEVTITDPQGITIKTTFATTVLPPTPGRDGALNTDVSVLFNPVIESLDAQRSGTDVTWTATITDDGLSSELTYAWSFTPNGTFTSTPSFVDTAVNPAIMQGYGVDVQGEVALAVTDINGATTTVQYTLVPDQFPDNPENNQDVDGLLGLSAGGYHVCARLSDGTNETMRCWGFNDQGQLGYGNSLEIGDDEDPYVAGDVPLFDNVTQIATGQNHTCALLSSGLVRCWGFNDYGQLGYGHTEEVGDGEAVTSAGYVQLGDTATQIVAGAYHTCALLESSGSVRCWGRNYYGQLGYGNTNDIGDDESPWEAGDVQVNGTVDRITAGAHHTCALLTNGKVRCWGRNNYGQLGYGHTGNLGDNESPTNTDPALGDVGGDVDVGGLAIDVDAGGSRTCALLATGYMRCWGYNSYGELGYGHDDYHIGDNETPAAAGDISTGGQVTQFSAGAHHTCALLATGELKCWGRGSYGALGYKNTSHQYAPPADGVDLGGSTAYQVTAGEHFTCALVSTGNAWCWGRNQYGQLGYADTTGRSDPTTGGDIQLLAP